ncbi:MAG TPA: DUF4142 domain-containing protein [Anaeromyxobacteraceae bacterium]|nr:DUF4142 domain-containing protein [Anaeromyxobacteraceae bacterium]
MTFVKWGMAAALALAFSPAHADDTKADAQKEMTEARQEAQEQKADAQKEASEKKAEAQKDMSEADRKAQEKMTEADRKAHEKMTDADREAREKTADAQKDMAQEGREVRASENRTSGSTAGAAATASADHKAPLSATAKETLRKLHASSQLEVGMARIAKDKAQNDKVKDLADKIQDDHSKMDDKVSDLARERNVELGTHDEMAKNRKHVEQMQKMQGADFDRHYAQMMAQEHKKDIAELRKAQTKLRANKADEDVAKLVDDALPKLEEHQKMAVEAQAALGSQQRQGRRGSSTSGMTSPSSTDSSDARTGTTGSNSPVPKTSAETNPGADTPAGPHTGADVGKDTHSK